MARAQVYEYLILFHPKAKRDTTGNEESLKSIFLSSLERVIATTEQEVTVLASRAIPEEYLDKLDQVEIKIWRLKSALSTAANEFCNKIK